MTSAASVRYSSAEHPPGPSEGYEIFTMSRNGKRYLWQHIWGSFRPSEEVTARGPTGDDTPGNPLDSSNLDRDMKHISNISTTPISMRHLHTEP